MWALIYRIKSRMFGTRSNMYILDIVDMRLFLCITANQCSLAYLKGIHVYSQIFRFIWTKWKNWHSHFLFYFFQIIHNSVIGNEWSRNVSIMCRINNNTFKKQGTKHLRWIVKQFAHIGGWHYTMCLGCSDCDQSGHLAFALLIHPLPPIIDLFLILLPFWYQICYVRSDMLWMLVAVQ